MSGNNFFKELKRRNVYKVAITYIVTSWLIFQAASIFLPTFEAPLWIMKVMTFMLAVGFPIALILAWAFEMSPDGIIRTSSIAVDENPYPDHKKNPFASKLLIGILLLVIIGQFAYSKYWDKGGVDTAKYEKSIAVLPFRNLSTNEENQYFCDGVMEGILDRLSQLGELHVISRTSAEKYRNHQLTMPEIGKELNVNYIVEGSVFRIGDQSQITAQLIYAPEDKHLWSEQYDKILNNVFAVMGEVVEAIASELQTILTPEFKERLATIPTENSKAYDFYLQGREFHNNYWNNGEEEDLNRAELFFQLAQGQDSTFALAYVGHALVYWDRNFIESYLEENILDTVLLLSNKALLLDPNAADAYWLRGTYFRYANRTTKALIDVNKALDLNPNHTDALRTLFRINVHELGNTVEAFRILKKIEKLDRSNIQLSATYQNYAEIYRDIGEWGKVEYYLKKSKEVYQLMDISGTLGSSYTLQGEHEKALEIKLNNLAADTSSQSYMRSIAARYAFVGDYEMALTYFNKVVEKIKSENPDHSKSISFGHIYGRVLISLGREAEGIRVMKEAIKTNQEIENLDRLHIISPLYNNAGIFSFLGEKEKAYEYLEKFEQSLSWPWGSVYYIQVDPLFDNIRDDEEFKFILNRALEEKARIREELAQLEASGEL